MMSGNLTLLGLAEELTERLRSTAAGATVMLSWPEFFILFKDRPTQKDQKVAATELAERCGCRALFLGRYEQFVRFTRRQPALRLRTDNR